ncbi:Carboxypeptidase D [Purpureocillium takamizusanense]|uniref:Carboxypeptidase n=1 Tax=Purpureocillium takamizusanense TaxID=2060973 RepID=A0A9Q8QQ05_9HYPO|nr:Carboxypeptidase D [Purpureocillium takamizusanense]UNI22664.1 Carboxypeptidase D [Purpureocillium takamizusanense]
MRLPTAIALLATWTSDGAAQFLSQDANARNLTVVRSPGNSNVTVSYKQPDGVCKTAFARQKQYTGWVNIPGDYPTNLFFWFVEARNPTENLTVWLNGGPGSSSMYGFFTGNGPCAVVEKGMDKYDTVAREWGWDRASNMLFIDQPNQVGFSYDKPTNGTISMVNETIAEPPVPPLDSSPDWDLINGTFSTNNANSTVNTTQLAAMGTWHVLQGFLNTFPRNRTRSNSSVAVSLFAESYGGMYGPIFAETWEAQNQKRLMGTLSRNSTVEVRLKSLGIVNGCIDRVIESPMYINYAINNTYGVRAYTDREAKFYLDKFARPGGCKDLETQCQAAAASMDPTGAGDQGIVNDLCTQAAVACSEMEDLFFQSNRSVYDLSAPAADPFPPMYFVDYLNQESVQRAIGSPINYTSSSDSVFRNFNGTGDAGRGGNVRRLAKLVQDGVRVGLIYGDRDYICNWFGGEAVSLSIAQQAGGEYATKFPAAGYAPIIVNDSYVGGEVRQFGNLSFSRVYQAGHAVASYQPETAFQVFARILLGTSVSTGKDIDLSAYNTTGPLNSTKAEKLPDKLKPTCYVRAYESTCDKDAQNLAASGEGVVINGILYSKSEDWPLATQTPTSTTTSAASDTMTGVFTATTTPTPTNAATAVLGPELSAWEIYASLLALHGLLRLI